MDVLRNWNGLKVFFDRSKLAIMNEVIMENSGVGECALLSEESLADWNRLEEDAAWESLQ